MYCVYSLRLHRQNQCCWYMCLTGRPTWKVVGILRRMAGSTSYGLFVAPITITCNYKNLSLRHIMLNAPMHELLKHSILLCVTQCRPFVCGQLHIFMFLRLLSMENKSCVPVQTITLWTADYVLQLLRDKRDPA